MSIFDDIKTGLNEAIEFEKGNLKAKTTSITIAQSADWAVGVSLSDLLILD